MSDAKTILTVDDSATMRDLLMSTLSGLGYRVVQAEDGVAALETLRDESPDVIITDVNMPRLDGLGLIEQIRSDTSINPTPILVLTTESDAAMKERARRAGATGWIVKPFDPQKLADILRRVTA